jgi:hypothetical protein
MPRIEYRITVVDRWSSRTFPSARTMIEAGLPVSVAARWVTVRREMSPAGLKRKLKDRAN